MEYNNITAGKCAKLALLSLDFKLGAYSLVYWELLFILLGTVTTGIGIEKLFLNYWKSQLQYIFCEKEQIEGNILLIIIL